MRSCVLVLMRTPNYLGKYIKKKMQNLFKYQIFHMILYEIDENVIYDEHIYNIISTKEQKL